MTTMEEKTKFGRSATTSWLSKPCILPRENVEKSRSRKLQLFFRGLHFGHFSKSLLILTGFQPTSRHDSGSTGSSELAPSTISGVSEDSVNHEARFLNSRFQSSASDISLTASGTLRRSSSVHPSPSLFAKRSSSSGGHRGLECKKPLLLEKVPFGKSGKYLTVYIGARSDQCVKYVIRRSLLKHPLFQLLLKCSEDEFGEDYTVNKGVAIVCDPELFIEVVRAVRDNLWSLGNDRVQVDGAQVRD